jgi:hypothetical protein
MTSALRLTNLQSRIFLLFPLPIIAVMLSAVIVFVAVSSNSSNFFSSNISNMADEAKFVYRPLWANTAFADHGEEVLLELNSGTFIPLTSAEGNQVRVEVNFTALNSTLIGNTINAVMKVYALNTTAIKSTSFPNGLIANNSGTVEIKTTINDNSTQNVTAVVQFTDVSKTIPMSNPVQIPLNLTEGADSMATPVEPEYEIAALPPE